MLGEVLQLACSLIDTEFEVSLMLAGHVLGCSELLSHAVERHRQHVELADAAAGEAGTQVPGGESFRDFHERSDRARDAADRGDRHQKYQQQYRDAYCGDDDADVIHARRGGGRWGQGYLVGGDLKRLERGLLRWRGSMMQCRSWRGRSPGVCGTCGLRAEMQGCFKALRCSGNYPGSECRRRKGT